MKAPKSLSLILFLVLGARSTLAVGQNCATASGDNANFHSARVFKSGSVPSRVWNGAKQGGADWNACKDNPWDHPEFLFGNTLGDVNIGVDSVPGTHERCAEIDNPLGNGTAGLNLLRFAPVAREPAAPGGMTESGWARTAQPRPATRRGKP